MAASSCHSTSLLSRPQPATHARPSTVLASARHLSGSNGLPTRHNVPYRRILQETGPGHRATGARRTRRAPHGLTGGHVPGGTAHAWDTWQAAWRDGTGARGWQGAAWPGGRGAAWPGGAAHALGGTRPGGRASFPDDQQPALRQEQRAPMVATMTAPVAAHPAPSGSPTQRQCPSMETRPDETARCATPHGPTKPPTATRHAARRHTARRHPIQRNAP